jgi:hypothetical protein
MRPFAAPIHSSSPCRWQRRPLLFFLLLSVGGGCSDGRPDAPLGMVRGRVTWEGAPLADATVAFEPEHGRASYGRTNAEGEYELRYRGKPWGAVAGRHRVRITTEATVADATGREQQRPELLPAKYHASSALAAEVRPGDNVFNFDLTADR